MQEARQASNAGLAIRAQREALGMSQSELAARAGVSPGHLSRVERGAKATRIYLDHLSRVIAEAIAEAATS